MIKNVGRIVVTGLFVFSVFCFGSCKKKIANRQDLIAYINDPESGLQKAQQIGDMKVALTYRPWQIMAQKGRGINNKTDSGNSSRFKDQLFFVLSISAKNKELLRQLEFNKYSEMVQVLAFRMKEFIDVVPDSAKPVEPLNCVFQQTYGMGTANNILIVFNKDDLMKADNLKIRIKEFGLQTGNLNFEFKTDNIKNLPTNALN